MMRRYWFICTFLLMGLLLPAPRAQAQDDPGSETIRPGWLRIVGGESAKPGEWPWQVVVLPGNLLCGGSLLNPAWVLTAAHCVFDLEGSPWRPDEIFIIAGEHDLTLDEGVEQRRGVAQVVVHPDYDDFTADNDIALLKLSAPMILNDRVGTIAVIDATMENTVGSPGTVATVTGWGALAESGGASRLLQEVNVPIVSNGLCNNAYDGAVTENMVCAGYEQGGKDACQGDSGGPLVVPQGDGGWLQMGIVSWGDGCARPARYGVYTRLSRHVAWIQSQISEVTLEPLLVSVENGVLLPETTETTFVTVRVSDIPATVKLGAITLDMEYDSSLVKATSCQTPENAQFDQSACGLDAQGVLRISALAVQGVADDTDIVRVGFAQVGGAAGSISPLTLKNIKPVDVKGTPLPAEHEDGELRLGCATGDVTCDGAVTGTDSMFVLQFAHGLRAASSDVPPPAGTLYLPACDVDDNEACDPADADIILQCDAFIANDLCAQQKGALGQ